MKYKLLCALNDFWYSCARIISSFILANLAIFFALIGQKQRALKCILASFRFGRGGASVNSLRKMMGADSSMSKMVSWGVELNEAAARSIIIKWPTYNNGVVCKGLIVITFTKTFSYFLRRIDLEAMSNHFIFVLEPSWSGYADPDILGFVGRLNNVLIESSAVEDRAFLNCFPETFIPVSFGASDWVDIDIFQSLNVEKKYDSIYIANTNPIKRVKRYLDAIKNIVAAGNEAYVGCLVCAAWGGAEKLILEMVKDYDLKNNIVLKFSLSREEVIESLNQSKVNILLSYKEGSNRSLFEAIFCNIPVICLSENVGVNKGYINEFTGLLIPNEDLESSLLWIKDNYTQFSPRDWALKNISPEATTEKLHQLIVNRFNIKNNDLMSDIYIKTNNPEVSYFRRHYLDHKKYSREILTLFDVSSGDKSIDYSVAINSAHAQFCKDDLVTIKVRENDIL